MIEVGKSSGRVASKEEIVKRKKNRILGMLENSRDEIKFAVENQDNEQYKQPKKLNIKDIIEDDEDLGLDMDDIITKEEDDNPSVDEIRARYNRELGYELSDDQFEAVQGITNFIRSEYDPENFSATLSGYAGTGKGLVYGTPVLTKRGWISIELLKADDLVATPEGTFVSITGIYDRGLQNVFRITFSDGRIIECDYDHLWTLNKINDINVGINASVTIEENITINTGKLFEIIKSSSDVFYLPKIKPIFNEDFYNENKIYISEDEFDICFENETIEGISVKRRLYFYYNTIRKSLLANKFSDIKNMSVQFISSKKAFEFVSVARSLGFNYSLDYIESESVYIAKAVGGVSIKSIEYIGQKPTVCIAVNSDSHLFITKDYIPTHNTTVTKLIYNNCVKMGVKTSLCAPTHRAKYVLSKSIGTTASTLHSFLHLSPTLDIEKLSMDDLIFKLDLDSIKDIPLNGVVFIDECSMISDEMFDFLKKMSNEFYCKVVYIGDSAQLRAVNSNDISKVFNLNNVFSLKTVHRQKDESALVPYLLNCREKPITDFNTKISKAGSLYVTKEPKDFIRSYVREVRKAIEERKPDNTRILCYRNSRVKEFNDIIRRCLYKGSEYDIPYHIGDILMGYSNIEYEGNYFYNSSDYVILEEPEKIEINIDSKFRIPGYELCLGDFADSKNERKQKVSIADLSQIDRNTKREIAKYIEELRLEAVNAKYNRPKAWERWRAVFNTCAINDDLEFDNRIIKKKTFDYGYALSVHRSQGCTFNNIYVDISDIFLNRDEMELRQLEYVAMSRTKSDCYILL